MTNRFRSYAHWCGLAVMSAIATSAEVRAEYQFRRVVDASGQFAAFPWGPSINNAGELLFVAELDNGDFGLYRGAGPTFEQLAFSNGLSPYRDSLFANFADFNDSGEVVFHAVSFQHGFGVYVGPNPATDAIATQVAGFTSIGQNPVINNQGDILFSARRAGGISGLFRGGDPVADLYVDNSGAFNFFNTQIDLNDNGDTAFVATLDSGVVGLFLGPNPVADLLVDSSGPFNTMFSAPRLNESGELIFRAELDSGGSGIYRGPDPEADKIVHTADGFELIGGAAINNRGDVIFSALYDGGKIGLFDGVDANADRIIGVGDELFGSTVVANNGYSILNDLGEISISYVLANGERGLAIGRPMKPGDFDDDGDVDGADFLSWQLGESPDPTSGSDLADWQANFGSAIAASASNVPEPIGATLMAVAAVMFCRRSRT